MISTLEKTDRELLLELSLLISELKNHIHTPLGMEVMEKTIANYRALDAKIRTGEYPVDKPLPTSVQPV